MNRWEAVVEIVKSFNERDRPGYALAALMAFVAAAVGITALASFGAIGLGELVKLLS